MARAAVIVENIVFGPEPDMAPRVYTIDRIMAIEADLAELRTEIRVGFATVRGERLKHPVVTYKEPAVTYKDCK